MGTLRARRGQQKAPHPGQNAFFAIFEKKGVAGIFREATATANRNGVQAKRSFFDRRRDFWVSNILTTQNSTDSGDTP